MRGGGRSACATYRGLSLRAVRVEISVETRSWCDGAVAVGSAADYNDDDSRWVAGRTKTVTSARSCPACVYCLAPCGHAQQKGRSKIYMDGVVVVEPQLLCLQ